MKKYYTKKSNNGPSAEDMALETFAEMMIKRIETISDNWQKPWFTEGAIGWPKNVLGREYNGMNALMLLMHCEDKGYKLPYFCTFERVQEFNESRGDKPAVLINKGEKSFPVMLMTFICLNKETGEKIKYEDYKTMGEAEQKKYNVFPRWRVFRVFNVAQTNLKDARPDFWARMERETLGPKTSENAERVEFAPMDAIIDKEMWICKINLRHQDRAFFSPKENQITVPEKEQFKDGESFYGTLWHEMAHSTGVDGQLNRLTKDSFGSEGYAREELVAELSSALVAQRYGMDKKLKDESCQYLKSWLKQLHEDPKYIKTILTDVNKATSMITGRVDMVAKMN